VFQGQCTVQPGAHSEKPLGEDRDLHLEVTRSSLGLLVIEVKVTRPSLGLLFLVRQELNAQGPESVLLEPACHLAAALGERLAPGLLGEDNDATGVVRKLQRSIEKPIRDEDGHFSLLAHDRASADGRVSANP
jgi:hypothetical protein